MKNKIKPLWDVGYGETTTKAVLHESGWLECELKDGTHLKKAPGTFTLVNSGLFPALRDILSRHKVSEDKEETKKE